MLNNLEHGRLGADPASLARCCELHLTIPDLGDADRSRLETLLRSVKARWN